MAHHVHESPKVMTIPLIILAFFSVTIGWIGMPGALIPHSNLFGDFLAPVFPAAEHAAEGTHGLEQWLMIFSVFVALAGIRLAYSCTSNIPPGRSGSRRASGSATICS